MNKIKIITDSACDLPVSYVKENDIEVVCLKVNITGDFINDDLGQTLKYDWFYDQIRDGATPTTAQANAYEFEEAFKKYTDEGYSVICLTIASPLSGTYNSANIAKESILEENPNADVTVLDSLSVSLGQGALVYYATEMVKAGKTKEEIVAWLTNNRGNINHAIVIDDLSCLKRGGRISSATALVGGLLNIKPTLSLDENGALLPGTKIKGKKKVLRYLANEVKDKSIEIENQVIFICHADCLAEAEALKELILEENKVKDVVINYIGTAVGSHGGPGTLAAVFIGNGRA